MSMRGVGTPRARAWPAGSAKMASTSIARPIEVVDEGAGAVWAHLVGEREHARDDGLAVDALGAAGGGKFGVAGSDDLLHECARLGAQGGVGDDRLGARRRRRRR